MLHFSIGAYFGQWHTVEWKNDRLEYHLGINGTEPTMTRTPSPEAWAEFWAAMDKCGVWEWQACYDENAIDDGTEWSLQLEHSGRRLNSKGSSDFPGGHDNRYTRASSFGKFLRALEKLTGVKGIR